MAYVGLNEEMDAATELGRNLASKNQIQPKYDDEQVGTRNGTAEPVSREIKFPGVNWDRKKPHT